MATGFMGMLSMGFAMYIIFNIWVACIIGPIWGLIVFNLDRFIVSSTGKGDGKDTISKNELVNALPRLFMAGLLGLTISAPLEIYIFDKEIQLQVSIRKDERVTELKTKIQARYVKELAELDAEKKRLDKIYREKEQQVKEQDKQLNDEMSGNAGARGYGQEARKKEARLNELKGERDAALQKTEDLQKQIDEKIKQREDEVAGEKEKILASAPGLLERLLALEDVPGSTIPVLMVRLLFIFIEIAPVLFKLMLMYSPYDYLNDNVSKIIQVRQGIGIKEEFYKDVKGGLVDYRAHYVPNTIIDITEKLLERQKQLSNRIIDKWAEGEEKKIDADPGKYIKLEDPTA